MLSGKNSGKEKIAISDKELKAVSNFFATYHLPLTTYRLLCRLSLTAFLLTTYHLPLTASPLRVVTTTEDLAALAREIGKDKVEVVSLTRGRQDPHYIEVKPSYMIQVSRADLFVLVGLDLDLWAFPLLDGARNSKVRPGAPGFVDASEGIEVLEIPTGKVDRSMGDIHPRGNPHYWLAPDNGKVIAKNILAGLCRVSAADCEYFSKNYENFLTTLSSEIKKWKKNSAPLKDLKVVTYHKTWSYFTHAFGLKVVNYIEPKAGVPPPPKHIQELISQIRAEKISVIVAEPYFDKRLPARIAKETGAKVLTLAPSVGSVKEVKNYFELFDSNLKLLLKATEN